MSEIEDLKRRIYHLENQVNLLTEIYLELKSDQWVDSRECCEKLKISRSTLERYRKQAKEGVHYKIHGERGYRYNWQKMQELLRGNHA
jgi:predicted site-specific integrase-resolvase